MSITPFERKDTKTLKALNKETFKNNCSLTRSLLETVAASPVVALEAPSVDSDLNEATIFSGLECLAKPFYGRCVYSLSPKNNEFLLIQTEEEETFSGISYSDLHYHMGYFVPMVFTKDAVRCLADNDAEKTIRGATFVDLAAYRKSRALRAIARRVYEEYKNDEFEMLEPTVAFIRDVEDAIKDGTHPVGKEELDECGLNIEEYSLAYTFACTVLVRTVWSLGSLHLNDYYPFEALPSKKKRKERMGKKVSPVLNPSRAVIRFIQKRVACEHYNAQAEKNGSKRAHSRRGCWVTLRDKRYKNHPMYQVENGVYRRESWINCEPFPIGNVIYVPVNH